MATGCSNGQLEESSGYLAVGSPSGYVNVYDVKRELRFRSTPRSTSFMENHTNEVIEDGSHCLNLDFEDDVSSPSVVLSYNRAVQESSEHRSPLKVPLYN